MTTILIVDDHESSREYLASVLRHSNHRILEAENGHEALAVMQAKVPDLVITDILMPAMDGFELVRRMRGSPETRNTPVVLFTGAYDESKVKDLASQCPRVTTLYKPAESEKILRAIEHALRAPPQQATEIGDGFEDAHLKLVTTRLHETATELELANAELAKLGDSLKIALSKSPVTHADKTVLLKEVHHRVKNNLAVIAGLLSMQAFEATNPETEMALQLSQQRVRSMALIHELLCGSEDLDRVNLSEFAERIAIQLHRTLASQPELVKVRVNGEPIDLGVEQAIPCGMILNELLMNSFKYAFVGGRAGEVIVEVRRLEPASLLMSVEDDGIGMAQTVDWAKPKSLGLEIVQILTKQLGATIEHKPGPGTRFELNMVLA